jgi:imidazolonepropionase-like amidohydrolase
MSYRTVGERLSKWALAWTDIDWQATLAIQDEMINRHVAYCPTLVAHELHAQPAEDLSSGAEPLQRQFGEKDPSTLEVLRAHIEADWDALTRHNMFRALSNRLKWIEVFRERGGTVVAGTDLAVGGVTIVRELELLVNAGMTPKEAIRSATEDAAKMLTKSAVSGRLEVGQEASLILTHGRPDEDVRALRRPAAVFLRGRQVTPDALSRAATLQGMDDQEGF